MKNMSAKSHDSPVFALLLAAECLVWGFSNAFIKPVLGIITPLWCLVFRYSLATVLFLVFFGRRVKRNYKPADLRPCLIVSFFTAAAFILGFVALAHTSATNCGFLMNLAVVFTPLLSVPFLKTKFRPRILLPVGFAALGLFFISGGNLTSLNYGDILSCLCSVASAMMLITSAKYLRNVDAMVLAVVQCAVCFVASLAFALLFEPLPDFASYTPRVWVVIAYLVVFSTFLAYYFQNVALSRVSATLGSLMFCLEPIFTAVFAYFLLEERLSAMGVIGAVCILGGITLASLFEGRSAEPESLPPA